MTDRVTDLGPRTRRFLEAAEGERVVRIRTLAVVVLVMSLINSLIVAAISADMVRRYDGPRLTPLFSLIGTVIGGGVLSWGLDIRKQWAWIVAMLAFGSLFLGSLFLATYSLFHPAVEPFFPAMVAVPFSLLPLLLIWRDRLLFRPPDDGEDEGDPE